VSFDFAFRMNVYRSAELPQLLRETNEVTANHGEFEETAHGDTK